MLPLYSEDNRKVYKWLFCIENMNTLSRPATKTVAMTEAEKQEMHEATQRTMQQFLRLEFPKEDLPQKTSLSLAILVRVKLETIPLLSNPKEELEALGYVNMEQAKNAYQKAIEHYLY
jgi:hypothetical protein